MAAAKAVLDEGRLEEIEAALQESRAASRDLVAALAAAETEASNLRALRDAMDAELEAARKRRRESGDRLRKAQDAFRGLRQESTSKRSDLDTLERRYDKVRWTLHELELEAESLRKRNREKGAAVDAARKRLKAMEHAG